MTALSDLIEALLKNLTDRIALAILFASIIAFLLMLAPGEIGALARGHWQWPFWGFLGSACYLPTRYILDSVSASLSNREKHSHLYNLTKKEKELLAPYIQNDYRARRILHTDPVAKGLADAGILYLPDVNRDQNGYLAYNIQNWARTYLRKHPDILEGIPNLPRAGDS